MSRHRIPRTSTLVRLLEELEKIQDDLGVIIADPATDTAEERVKTAHPNARKLLEQYRRSMDEAFGCTVMFGNGAGQHLATARHIPSSNKWEKWTHDMTKQQLGTAVIRMFVLFSCGELEFFVRDLARWWLKKPSELSRIRRLKRRPQHLSKDDQKARDMLVDWVKPSSGARGLRWSTRIQSVFGCKLPKSASTATNILIKWRNEFSHRSHAHYDIDWSGPGPDFAEAMISWFLAAIVVSQKLVLATMPRQPRS